MNQYRADVTKEDIPSEDKATIGEIGIDYMERAANAGDRASMVFLVHAYDPGHNIGDIISERSIRKTFYWLEEIQTLDNMWLEDTGMEINGGCGDEPSYKILARLAEIWLIGYEAENIRKDPMKAGELYEQAAESAMSSMAGKLANKYYMLAEEAYSQVEDENDIWGWKDNEIQWNNENKRNRSHLTSTIIVIFLPGQNCDTFDNSISLKNRQKLKYFGNVILAPKFW